MPDYTWVTENIFTVNDFFTPTECADYVQWGESLGFADAPITTSFGPQIRRDVRNNTRVMIDDSERAAELWRRSVDYIPIVVGDWRAVGVNERFRLYRYDVGQQFDWHYDGAYERGNGERSWLTFMVYLNGDFEGGQTSFDQLAIEPECGKALIFAHHLRHKGEPVSSGRKYVLRTDVMYRHKSSG
jgi:hypothetical protein